MRRARIDTGYEGQQSHYKATRNLSTPLVVASRVSIHAAVATRFYRE